MGLPGGGAWGLNSGGGLAGRGEEIDMVYRCSSATRIRCCAGLMICAMVASAMSPRAEAEEPVEKFLNALRDNGYYDAALLYLERLDGSPLVTPQFQAELLYQRGITLVQAARVMRDRRSREQMLDAAKESLEKFLREQPDNPKRLFAQRQFSLLLRQWAAMKAEQAKRASDPQLMKEASKLYDDAYQASVEATKELREALLKLKEQMGPTPDKDQVAYRDSLRGEYLLALLRGAESLEEKATTEPADSPAHKSLLEEAIKNYAEMYKKYGTYAAGVRARLGQARCLVALGDYETALKYLTEDLLGQTEDDPVFRQIKTEAMLLAMDCWMQGPQKDYATAVSRAGAWLDTQRPAEEENPDWILLQLKLARAHKAFAEQLAQKNPRDNQIKESRDAARKLARVVSRLPSEYQEQGRVLLAEIPGGVAVARVETREPAKTFEEARTRGTDAISEMQTAQYFVDSVPERLEREPDEQVKAQLEQQLKQQKEAITLKRGEAMDNLTLALSLADANTPVDDLSLVQRLLAYLYYTQGEYYDSAVLGEFSSRRFPGAAGSQQAARTALASYLKLYESEKGGDRDFETEHIVSLAGYIVNTWTGSPEAAEAINTLIPFLIRQDKLDEARQYVESLPPNSAERGSADLQIGDALWRRYLVGMRELREWERAAREPDADAAELNCAGGGPQTAAGGDQEDGSGSPGSGRGADEGGGYRESDSAAGRTVVGSDLCGQ